MFPEFPEAHPHFKESELRAQRTYADILAKRGKLTELRDLNKKITDSQTYYDLTSLVSRGISPTKANYDKLIDGFTTLNTSAYNSKGSGLKGSQFDDPDSRWYGISRSVARDMIIDEIFQRARNEDSKVPQTDADRAKSAEDDDTTLTWLIPLGVLTLSIGIGIMIHRATSPSANQ